MSSQGNKDVEKSAVSYFGMMKLFGHVYTNMRFVLKFGESSKVVQLMKKQRVFIFRLVGNVVTQETWTRLSRSISSPGLLILTTS